MENVFKNIFSIECADALHFDLEPLDVIDITEFKKYHGIKIKKNGFSYIIV